MLSTHASCLQSSLLSLFFKLLLVFALVRDRGELAQDGLSLACAHIRWASCDDTVSWVLSKLKSALFHFGEKLTQGVVDNSKIIAMHN